MATEELPGALLKAGMAYTTRMFGLSVRLVGALLPDVARVVDIQPSDRATPPRADGGGVQVEAVAGTTGYGVFMVENRGREPVTTDVDVSSFSAGSGRPVRPAVAFEPSSLMLAPGEQALVQVGVTVKKNLRSGVAYRATISLPGLEGATIPIAVTRRS
jgi:hypothetical protein